MICRSSWISTQKRTPSGVAAPDGVFLLVLTALAHQAVKPLAQIIDYYLCYATATTAASGGNREELLGPRPARCECRPRHEADAGSRNPYRMPEGPQCQYNTSSDPIQQKAPGIATTGGLCFVHCMNPMDKFSSPYRSPVDAPWRKSQACTQKMNTSPAKGPMIHRESGHMGVHTQKSVICPSIRPSWPHEKISGLTFSFTMWTNI